MEIFRNKKRKRNIWKYIEFYVNIFRNTLYERLWPAGKNGVAHSCGPVQPTYMCIFIYNYIYIYMTYAYMYNIHGNI